MPLIGIRKADETVIAEYDIKKADFDISFYPVRAQGTTGGVQYTTAVSSSGADTDVDLWTFDAHDYFPRLTGSLAWAHYDINLELKAGSTSSDVKWRLKARDRGATGWTNMCALQTETDIGTTYAAKAIAGYLDIQDNIENMPFEMKIVMQSNESSTASGEAIGRIKNDTIIRAVGEVS